MPCFLKVIVGSKSVADASSLMPGPESCTSMATSLPSDLVMASTDPPGPAASPAFCSRLVRMPFTRSGHACTRGTPASSRRAYAVSGCAGRSSDTRSVTSALTSSTSGCIGGSLENSEKARTRRSSESISLTTIWTA